MQAPHPALARMNPTTIRAGILCCALALQACSKAEEAGGNRTTAAALAKTQAVGTQPLVRELLAVGSLRSDEAITLRPEIAGRIVRIGFDEGRSVTAGQLMFALDDSVDRAEREKARAEHRLAQRSHERAQELLQRKLVSPADADQAAANLQAATAALALAEARLEKTRILAPFAGTAGLRRVSPGDYVSPGQDLVGLEAMATMKVDFRVDQAALPELRAGQTLEVEIDAWPGERFDAELYAIEPRVAETTRSISLRARLPNPDGRLRPGQFARVRLAVEQKLDAIVIPEQAVFPRGGQQFVFVVVDGHAQLREVSLGQRMPGSAEIVEGLRAGEAVVVAGVQQLSDGRPVREERIDAPLP
jgi:membrane fusion protein, multidrug efflux system